MVTERGASEQESLTLREAAERCTTSLSAIRRRLKAGAFPHAFKGVQGEWRIPVSDLEAAGFTPDLSPAGDGEPAREQAEAPSERPVEQDVNELWARVSEAERRAALAEARLQERERTLRAYVQANEDLRSALRMLNPGPPVFRYESEHGERRRPGWLARWRRRGRGSGGGERIVEERQGIEHDDGQESSHPAA